MQGYAPASVLLLGISPAHQAHLLPGLGVLGAVLFFVPRFEFPRDGAFDNAPALISAFWACLLFGALAAPLPWQHSYSMLFLIVPWTYLLGTHWERRILALLGMGIALSARGVIGYTASGWLEDHQSLMFLITGVAILLLIQARRLGRSRSAADLR